MPSEAYRSPEAVAWAMDVEGIEREAEVNAARLKASLEEPDTEPVFDFCEGCPRIAGHAAEEANQARHFVGGILASLRGSFITMQLGYPDNSRSESMLLEHFPGHTFVGKMYNVAISRAARRTRECEGPKRTPRILGPIGIKKCPAIEKSTRPEFE